MTPRYLRLHESGELARRAESAAALSDPCRLCPRRCGARRLHGETGPCGGGAGAHVSTALLHTGEEPPISGARGSGTIFFFGCALGCGFCQNHQISRGAPPEAARVDDRALAELMLGLAAAGAHNVNWVTPSHVLPAALRALDLAAARGLEIPLVYNCSGYQTPEALALLDGVVDVALPDLKWLRPESERACGLRGDYAPNIGDVLHRWFDAVGPLTLDDDGLAVSGLLVRHLVLPGNLSDTDLALALLEPLVAAGAGVSLMAQYHPPGGLRLPPPLDRTLTADEYYGFAYELRMQKPHIAFIQDLEAHGIYNPDFDTDDPFRRPETP
jgi:putative pyruvate formate lyase activating enzyme